MLLMHTRFDDDGAGDMYSDVDDMEPIVSNAILVYSNILGHYRLMMKLAERRLQ